MLDMIFRFNKEMPQFYKCTENICIKMLAEMLDLNWNFNYDKNNGDKNDLGKR